MPHATDRIFFRELAETWHVAVPCPVEGNVDEMVSWKDAKTPRSAAAIAEMRHQKCHVEAGKKADAVARKENIAAAVQEVERIKNLLPFVEREYEQWMEEAEKINDRANSERLARAPAGTPVDRLTQLDYDARIATKMMHQTHELLEAHREGLKQAKARLTETRKQNTKKQ